MNRRRLLLSAAALPFAEPPAPTISPTARSASSCRSAPVGDRPGCAPCRRGAETASSACPPWSRTSRAPTAPSPPRSRPRPGRYGRQSRLLEHRGGLERRHDEVPALRPDQGLRAVTLIGRAPVVPDRQSQGRGDDGAGIRGAVPQAARQDQLGSGSASTRISGELRRPRPGSTWCTCPTRARPPPCRTRWPAMCKCASPIR